MWNKVPAITFAFWVVKVCATTLGETGGDALSMTLHLGYLISTMIFLGFFLVTLTAQVASRRYHPVAYWLVVVATTTVGTTLSDYMDRSLGLGYPRASLLLGLAVIVVLVTWKMTTGSINASHITTRRNEIFYWVAILVSNTLGTALGDYTADSKGIGFVKGALIFAGLIALIALLHFTTKISGSVLFWAAYVLTRPLGATLGDTLTKPHAEGGLALGRIASSLTLATVMVALIALTSLRRPAPDDGEAVPA